MQMQSHMDVLGAQHKHRGRHKLQSVQTLCYRHIRAKLRSVRAISRAQCKSKAVCLGKDIFYFPLFNTLSYLLKILINGHIL